MGFNFSMMMKNILNNKTKILLTLFSITFTALIIFDQSQPGTIQNIKDKQIFCPTTPFLVENKLIVANHYHSINQHNNYWN